MLLATEQTIVPMANNDNAAKMTDLRPMMCEKDAQDGWKTVEHL